MSTTPFRPGDKVVCINASCPRMPDMPLGPLVRDAIYCVSDCWPVPPPEGGYCVRLLGEPVLLGPYGVAYGWDSERFRRVWTQDVRVEVYEEATR